MPPLSVTISNKLRKLLAATDYQFSCLAQVDIYTNIYTDIYPYYLQYIYTIYLHYLQGFSPSVEFRWFLGDVSLPVTAFQQVTLLGGCIYSSDQWLV